MKNILFIMMLFPFTLLAQNPIADTSKTYFVNSPRIIVTDSLNRYNQKISGQTEPYYKNDKIIDVNNKLSDGVHKRKPEEIATEIPQQK